jgi:hypothetical protein
MNPIRSLLPSVDQTPARDGIDVLLEIGYEIMTWNMKERPDRGDGLVGQWISSPSLALRRLAIIGVSENHSWSFDRKISWLIQKDLVFALLMKQEIFRVLERAYPGSSESLKDEILSIVKTGSVPGVTISEDILVYERYNMLGWLHSIAPDSEITANAFEAIQKQNPQFKQRSRPDLDIEFGSGGWVSESRNPVSVVALLSKRPHDQIDWLVSFQPENIFGDGRNFLVEAVKQATIQNFLWGQALLKELADKTLWDSDLWAGVIMGWGDATLDTDQWKQALGFLISNQDALRGSRRDLAVLLLGGSRAPSQPLAEAARDEAIQISKLLWSICAVEDKAPDRNTNDDWLFTAINQPAGMLAQFWLTTLSNQRKEAGDGWNGIPADTKVFFEGVISHQSFAGDLARIVFASQLTFLSSIDREWSEEKILPLLDWDNHGKRALQALQGFLGWGRQTERLIQKLLPLYRKIFPHTAELGKSRRRFSEYLAGAACFSSINPLIDGWLDQFISNTEEQDRVSWAISMRQMLKATNEDSRARIWDSWIGEYWQRRLEGVPLRFDTLELGETVEWSLFLGAAFPKVVEKIDQSPPFELRHSFIYRELEETRIPNLFPEETAKFLIQLLRNERKYLFDFDKIDALVRRIAALNAPEGTLSAICEELSRLGYQAASSLHDWVRRNRQS